MNTESQQEGTSKNKMEKPNNVVFIPADFSGDFFRKWCLSLNFICKLSEREMDVTASLLRQRELLSKSISDPKLLDTVLMTKEISQRIMDDCNITQQNLYVIMGNLRGKGVLTSKGINPLMIPDMKRGDNKYFQLVFLFENTAAQENSPKTV